jgi:hypothetical protein
MRLYVSLFLLAPFSLPDTTIIQSKGKVKSAPLNLIIIRWTLSEYSIRRGHHHVSIQAKGHLQIRKTSHRRNHVT